MVRANIPSKVSPAAGGKLPAYNESDIDELEKVALERANKALSAIENAIAVWEHSAEKPDELQPRINRLKAIHDALANWEKKVLRSMGKPDMASRVENLREFSDICFTYSRVHG